MKKYIISLLFPLLMLPETEAATVVSTKTTITETVLDTKIIIKRRRKKGFLWGLFKKKDCGCPKH